MGTQEWQQLEDKATELAGIWVVTWHERDHAEGQVFVGKAAAEAKYKELDGGAWAARLYDPAISKVKQYGSMGTQEWQQLEDKATELAGIWVVTWHERDHAEGQAFVGKAAAEVKYKELDGGAWAARLYDPAMNK